MELLKLIHYDLSSTTHTETLMRAAVSVGVLDLLCGFEVLKALCDVVQSGEEHQPDWGLGLPISDSITLSL